MTEAVIIQKPVYGPNQQTGFYMITASVMKELNSYFANVFVINFFFSTRLQTCLMYKKSNWFVYKFVVNCRVF